MLTFSRELSVNSYHACLDESHHETTPLPPLNEFGLLPPGIYEASLLETERRYARTPSRKELWRRLLWFLTEVSPDQFSCVYLAGGFVTAKPAPSDIDVILQPRASFGPKAYKAMEPFFAYGLDKFLNQYCVHLHFWCEGFPNARYIDFRTFFQEPSFAEALTNNLQRGFKKGMVKIPSDELGHRIALLHRAL